MRRNRSYRRGDIFLADLGIPHGSEQGGRRPVIILQNDDGCLFSPTVTMVPLTTNLKKTCKGLQPEGPVRIQGKGSEGRIHRSVSCLRLYQRSAGQASSDSG